MTTFDKKKVNEYGNNLIYEILKTICLNEDEISDKWNDFKTAIKHKELIDLNYTERENGRNALHFAISSRQHQDYIHKLIESGTSKLLTDKYGHTPYDLAIIEELNQDLLNLLKSQNKETTIMDDHNTDDSDFFSCYTESYSADCEMSGVSIDTV